MYGTNSRPLALTVAARWILVLVALCMLVSVLPCAEIDADEVCEDCDQDDVITALAMPYPRASVLLLEQPSHPCLIPPASLAERFPHPPTG